MRVGDDPALRDRFGNHHKSLVGLRVSAQRALLEGRELDKGGKPYMLDSPSEENLSGLTGFFLSYFT